MRRLSLKRPGKPPAKFLREFSFHPDADQNAKPHWRTVPLYGIPDGGKPEKAGLTSNVYTGLTPGRCLKIQYSRLHRAGPSLQGQLCELRAKPA
jgi:hypothetical protein